MKIIAIN